MTTQAEPSRPAGRTDPPSGGAAPLAVLAVAGAELLFLVGLAVADALLTPLARAAWPHYPEVYLAAMGAAALVGYGVLVRAMRGAYLSAWGVPAWLAEDDQGEPHPLRQIGATRVVGALAGGAAVLVPYAVVRNDGWVVLSLLAAGLIAVWQVLAARATCQAPGCDAVEAGDRDTPFFQDTLDALRAFAAEQGADDVDIRVVAGLGAAGALYAPTRPRPTVAIAPELVAASTPAELRAVLAHELAHHKLGHSGKTVLARAAWGLLAVVLTVTLLAALGPVSRSEWAVVGLAPAVVLMWYVMLAVLRPAMLAVLRRQEIQAARLALQMAPDADAFAAAMCRVAGAAGPDNGSGGPSRLLVWLACEAPPLRDVLAVAEEFHAAAVNEDREQRS